MFNSLWASALTAIVLLTGLVSCSPENRSVQAPPFHPPLPILIQGQNKMDLRTWDARPSKDLHPTDFLDVREAHADHAEVNSTCQENGSSFSGHAEVNSSQPIPLFQVLPEELLLADLEIRNIQCVIHISLWNTAKAQHIFDWPGHLTGAPEATARLEHQGLAASERELNDITPSHLDGFRLRFSPDEPAVANWACTDFYLPHLDLDHVLPLSEFDSSDLKLRPERSTTITEVRTRQLCRIFIERQSDRRRLAMTPRFVLNLSQARLQISVTPAAPVDSLMTPLSQGAETTLARIQIHNPSQAPRRVRLDGLEEKLITNLFLHTEDFSPWPLSGQNTLLQSLTCTGETYIRSTQPPESRDKLGSTWSLAAGGTLNLELTFRAPSGFNRPLIPKIALRLKTQLLPLTELDMDNHVIHLWPTVIPDTVIGEPTFWSQMPTPQSHSGTSCQ